MSTASLSLPSGARAAGPAVRTAADAWAAPRAADLVIDVWAAPTGAPIAPMLLSPWPAPDPVLRLSTMAPPAALAAAVELPAPTIDMLVAPVSGFPPPSVSSAQSVTTSVSSSVTSAEVRADDTPTGRLRARMWAMIAGGVAATASVVTVIAMVL